MRLEMQAFYPSVQLQKYSAFLLYGQNVSLQDGLLQEVIQLHKTRCLTEKEFLQDPHGFLTPSLFEIYSNNIFIISEISEKSFPLFQDFISKNSCFIFLSSQLKTTSPWVQKFTKDVEKAAIACYQPCPKQSVFLTKRWLERYQITLSWNETQKIANGLQEGFWPEVIPLIALCPDIPLEKLLLSFSETSDEDWFLLKNDRWFHKLNLWQERDPSFCISLIRSWQKTLMQLIKVRSQCEQGASMKEALQSARVFFREEPAFNAEYRSWDYKRCAFSFGKLFQAELCVKRGDMPQATAHISDILTYVS